MKNLLVLALSLPMMACVVGSDGQTPGGDDDGPGPGPDPDPGTGLSGSITADETWTGPVEISGDLTIEAGVTVTVSAGAVVTVADNKRIDVKGTLDVQGTSASPAKIASADGKYFGGLTVSGSVTATYFVQRGGKITTQPGSSVTATDSRFSDTGGDFFVMNGGTLNVSFSQIGADVGATDATHCNMHFGGSGNTISVTKSNIIGTPFALMFYSGTNAIFTDNNWEKGANGAADWVDSQPGVTGDFSRSFFSAGAPVAKAGATFTLDNLAPARLTDTGPRP